MLALLVSSWLPANVHCVLLRVDVAVVVAAVVVIAGKTAAFLVPALCQLDYPPDLFPEDLEGPQLLLLVPSFELGVQACMLLYKLWGGNISSRTPGDPANMFSYTGPAGIKVCVCVHMCGICVDGQGRASHAKERKAA